MREICGDKEEEKIIELNCAWEYARECRVYGTLLSENVRFWFISVEIGLIYLMSGRWRFWGWKFIILILFNGNFQFFTWILVKLKGKFRKS